MENTAKTPPTKANTAAFKLAKIKFILKIVNPKIAPKPAPVPTPSKYGSANGFLNIA